MSKAEAVIFDWAGTTVDYGCFAPVQVFTEVFKNAGVEPTMEEVREPMGMLKWAHIRTMLEMPRIKEAWKELYGREPDCWFSPDSTGGMGRPYPYMIFRNMEELNVSAVDKVIKVGDTISDIREGKNAGVFTIGILEGSSLVGLSQAEYESLPEEEKEKVLKEAEEKYKEAGADAVVRDIRGILEYI